MAPLSLGAAFPALARHGSARLVVCAGSQPLWNVSFVAQDSRLLAECLVLLLQAPLHLYEHAPTTRDVELGDAIGLLFPRAAR
jgi:hypothetical protein